MAFFVDEEEAWWKCLKHPSKRQQSGICPFCLRDRLVALCPDCANLRPCSCCASTSSSSSSSSSSFFHLAVAGDSAGTIGRVSNLIDSEPALRRSRSMAIPFLRSRSRFVNGDRDSNPDSKNSPAMNQSRSATSFWSIFRKIKKAAVPVEHQNKVEVEEEYEEVIRRPVMMKSRSMAVAGSGTGDLRPATKGRGWYFPSPIKVFRQSKASKFVKQRSPMYRG